MIPVLAAGFYMLFDPPDAWFGNQTRMAIWLIAALLLVHLGYSGVSISYHSHGAELTDDYNERTKVTVGREVFGLLGMTLAVVLPTWLTFQFGDFDGYMTLGLLFLPIILLFSVPTLLWAGPSVHPPVIHAERNAFIAVLRAAQEPPVPPAAAGLRHQRRSARRRGDGDAVLCRTRAEGRQAAGRHHPARLFHRRRRQRAAVAAAVEANQQGHRLVRRHGHDGHRHGLRDLHRPRRLLLVPGHLRHHRPRHRRRLWPAAVDPGRRHQLVRGRRQQGQDRHLLRPVGARHQARHGDRRGGLAAGGGACWASTRQGPLRHHGADHRLHRAAGDDQDHRRAAHLVHPHRSRTRLGARRVRDGAPRRGSPASAAGAGRSRAAGPSNPAPPWRRRCGNRPHA